MQDMDAASPKRPMLPKYTVFKPLNEQKHFPVIRIIQSEQPTQPIELVEVELMVSEAVQIVTCRNLQRGNVWRGVWLIAKIQKSTLIKVLSSDVESS